MELFTIELNEPINLNTKTIYLGSQKRHPSVTDIKFINNELIVVAHRYASKVYLIEIVNNKHRIIDTIITEYENTLHLTESFQLYNNKIYLICYSEYLFIIDIINNNKLKILTRIKLNNDKTPYHGIKINKGYLYLSPSNEITNNKNNVVKFNLKTNTFEFMNRGDILDSYRMKDIIFMNDNLIVSPIVYKVKDSMYNKNFITNASICLFTFPQFKLLDKIEFTNIHFDLGINYNNHFLITAQDKDGGFIYIGKVNNNKLENITKKPIKPFPHSLDIYNDKLAYVSYGTSSVHFHKLTDFVSEII
jgi:hypothetical protein